MNVQLVSRDVELFAVCREILDKIDELDSNLTNSSPSTPLPEADLYIWDSPGREDLPPIADQSFSKHVFLLNRNEVTEFQDSLGSAEAAVLLKPVSRSCLSGFLRHAAST
jgi:hypothetical protein